jgi:hypothetical protein
MRAPKTSVEVDVGLNEPYEELVANIIGDAIDVLTTVFQSHCSFCRRFAVLVCRRTLEPTR